MNEFTHAPIVILFGIFAQDSNLINLVYLILRS